jgi:predicted regulator of Ras-like GTPase activity (Roadblock/LC7/MglB family)
MTRPVAYPLNAEPVNRTIVEMAGGYLFVTSISEGSTLAVLAERACDMGMIGYEMTLLATRVGHMLTPARRPATPGPADRMAR